ncbi:uncharacterized protein LOC114537203 [Dendronephthya gigantea]|uniref:uncharacterized protein LOC114537203 n=1 Tax=Dendronephthya gigantea TaxID=151771 RepID=UPI001069C422|nr:uncharacterized protein LOC114537203 [Dendronephthya gigantea]
MYVDDIPNELLCLEKLEQILLAQRIVFEKIIVMPKGQQKKVKGAICNVPVECDQSCSTPSVVLNALNWLKVNNPLYHNITIDISSLGDNVTSLQQQQCHDDLTTNKNNLSDNRQHHVSDPNDHDDVEEQDDPLNEYRQAPNETCLQSVLPDYPIAITQNSKNCSLGNEVYNIAPGENKHPVSLMMDKNCEELAFPVLFPKGRFGFTHERTIKLSPVKYFNARLLHYSGRFATNPEYLFFAQFITEQKKVSDSINIAMKKIQGQPVTASEIKSNVNKLKGLICQDQAYLFLRQIPGTPPYWQKFMYEVVAMVKQLGIPTWFMTLSCADLRWTELFQIIAKTQGNDITDEEIQALSYNDRCSMLNLNPVVVAKHFQHRVETFFTEVLLRANNPIGKIMYYALRIEFQMRGSPHLHALIWTSDCPKLTSDSKEAYIQFIDNHVHANLPDKNIEPELHELVKTYQKHNHSKTCRKYKNVSCRFNFGQFFTNRTIVAEPLSDELDEQAKTNLLERRMQILSPVKQKIDEVLNPSKTTYDASLSDSDILKSLDITEEQYYWALSISPDSDFELHLKRPVDSCFINNYFVAGMKGFAANVDLQPVFNHYKCITYVCSYFTKDETECSQAIMNAAKEAKAANMSIREGLKKVGAAFLSTREVSSQECVYRAMPELWLRKIFPRTVFVNTNLPEQRVRMTKTQEELDDLDDDSTDIFKSNIVERYVIRPTSIALVDSMCLAEFAAYYYKDYKLDCETQDGQPDILTDDIIENQSTITNRVQALPKTIKLLNKNESIFEPDADAISEAFDILKANQGNLGQSFDALNDQENADVQDEMPDDVNQDELFNEQLPSHLDPAQCNNESTPGAIATYHQPTEISDDLLRQNIRSLNKQQRLAYDTFLTWCRNKMKNLNSLKPVDIDPIYLFLTGGGGAGKSHVIKTIYHTAVKTFRHPPVNPELPTVLLMAPTGVAAINIDGTTINTGLAIPKEAGDIVPPLSDQRKTQLRLTLSELKLIVVDEISMVGNTTLLNIHQRLKDIFGTPSSLLFAGISIIVVGDLCQLPPIRKKFVFDTYRNNIYNLCHPWRVFQMIELVEIMRQRNDKAFIELLNRIRTANQTEDDIKVIQSRSVSPDDPNYPSHALHIWAENSPVNKHNNEKLEQLAGPLFVLKAKDQFPPNVRNKILIKFLQGNVLKQVDLI